MKKSTTAARSTLKIVEAAKQKYAEKHGIPVTEVYVIGSIYGCWTVGTYEERQAYFDSLDQ
ncbi:MAG: hypothetical protein ACI4DY_00760 [Monoglobaceae bacterium]